MNLGIFGCHFCLCLRIAHSVTCLAIGVFLCRHILTNRMDLYGVNELLDTRNLQLENEITVRKQEQEELRLRLEQHQIIMDQTTDIPVFVTIMKDTAGDNILYAVAKQLKNHVRSSDVVGRIGGDEFLVYLTEVETEDAALWKAQNLYTALGTLMPEQGAPPITCSIGVTVYNCSSIPDSLHI